MASLPGCCHSRITGFEQVWLLWKGERTWVAWWNFTWGSEEFWRGLEKTTIKGRPLGNKKISVDVGGDVKGRKWFGSKLKGQVAKMQIQTTQRCHFPTIGLVNIQILTTDSCWGGSGGEPHFVWGWRECNTTQHNTTLTGEHLAFSRKRTCGCALGGSSTPSGRQLQTYWRDVKGCLR